MRKKILLILIGIICVFSLKAQTVRNPYVIDSLTQTAKFYVPQYSMVMLKDSSALWMTTELWKTDTAFNDVSKTLVSGEKYYLHEEDTANNNINITSRLTIGAETRTQLVLEDGLGSPELSFFNYTGVGGYTGAEIAYNATYDGSNWKRQDVAKVAYCNFFSPDDSTYQFWIEDADGSENVSWTSPKVTIDDEGAIISSNIITTDSAYLTKCVGQFHMQDSMAAYVIDTWTNITWDTVIANESTSCFSFNDDSTAFIYLGRAGIIRVQGCFHTLWDGSNGTTASIFGRARVNGVEARCTQADNTRERNANDRGILPIIGTIYIEQGDTVDIQFRVTNLDYYLDGNDAVFDNAVGASINFEYMSQDN